MVEKQRLVDEQRDGAPAQRAQRVFQPGPLLRFCGLAVAAEQLGVDADEAPARRFEAPALFTIVAPETLAARVIDALGHLAEHDVVADVMITREKPLRHAQAADLRAGKFVIALVVGVFHHQIAVDHRQVGVFALDPLDHLEPVVAMMLMARAQMDVGDLHQSELVLSCHRALRRCHGGSLPHLERAPVQGDLALYSCARRGVPSGVGAEAARKMPGRLHRGGVQMPLPRAAILAALLCCCTAQEAGAQAADFPSRPIRLGVPFAPGGSTDTIARLLAQKMTDQWSRQVVVDNRSGGNGAIGMEIVARAAPDGHTLVLGYIANLGTGPALYPKLPYDAIKDFAHISHLVSAPSIAVIHPGVQARSLQEVIALARARPAAISFGTAAVGSIGHLSGELINRLAGVKMQHVPYKGGGQAVIDVLGGQIPMVIIGMSAVLQ